MVILVVLSNTIVAQKEQSNKHFSHTLETIASPEAIWKTWIDVSNWATWDTGLKDASLSEPFGLGVKGKLRSLEGRVSKFKIVSYEEGQSYTFKTNLPLGALYVKRFLEKKNDKTVFTHEVWFKGLTGGIFAKNFGPKFRKMLPEVMQKIKETAEK